MGTDGEETGVLIYEFLSITGKRMLEYRAVIPQAFLACRMCGQSGLQRPVTALRQRDADASLAATPTALEQ